MPTIAEVQRKLRETAPRILAELSVHPPTIGLIGVSGVGKSSTINALFRTDLLTSPTVACTKDFEAVDLDLALNKGAAKGGKVQLRVIDAPGLGEDVGRDPEYLEMYETALPICDVILWVMTARNRAAALDQTYLSRLGHFHSKIVFGINQIDLVEPLDWNARYNIPSEEQERNVDEIVADRKSRMEQVLGRKVEMVPYSSKTGFNLQNLFTKLVFAAPEERSWIFDSLQGFNYRDFVRAEVLDEIEGAGKETFWDKLVSWFGGADREEK